MVPNLSAKVSKKNTHTRECTYITALPYVCTSKPH